MKGRTGFYINLPAAGLVTALLAVIHIPESPIPVGHGLGKTLLSKLDLPGFVLFAPAAIMFLMGLEFGGREHPWNSAVVIGLLVGGIALFVIFLFWERRQGDEAMFPLALVRIREVWTSMLAGMLLIGGIVIVFAFYLPIYFQAVKGVSPLQSGLYVLPNILSSILMAVTAGVLGMLPPFFPSVACILLPTAGDDDPSCFDC